MKYSKIITIMLVTAMIFTASSAVVGARFSLRTRLAAEDELEDEKGVMKEISIPSPFSVNDRKIFVIDVENPITIVNGVKGYYPINLDEFDDSLKEDGLEVVFSGKVMLFSFVSILSIKAFMKGYLPIELTSLEKYNPDVNKPPKADFIWHPEAPIEGKEVIFNDMSRDEDGEVVSWKWDFGDKDYNEPDPVHVFEDAGVYAVRLVVTDDDGATDEIIHQIEVREEEPEPETVELILETEPMDICQREIFEYYPLPINEEFPTDGKVHLYYEIGTVVNIGVKKVIDDYHFEAWTGDFESELIEIEIEMDTDKSLCANYVYIEPDPEENIPPKADFSYLPEAPITGETMQFTDLSIDEDGVIVSWWWEFDSEDDVSTDQNPTHVFEEPGLHRVTLTVTDDDGDTDFIWKEFEVAEIPDDNEEPVANFEYEPELPLQGQEVQFNDLSEDDGEIVRWSWNFGDGTPLVEEQNPTHVFEEAKEYQVTLLVFDDGDLFDKITKIVIVEQEEPTPETGIICGTVRELGMSVPPTVISGAEVYVFKKGWTNSLRPTYQTKTNINGEYRIKVDPAEYKVAVRAQGYFPSSKDTMVKAGEEIVLDFSLLKIG